MCIRDRNGSGTTFTARTGFTEIREDDTTSAGDAVSTLLSSASATDEELPGGVTGVAVTSVTNTNGNWQFSTDGTNFNNFGSPSPTLSRLLDGANSDHKIRFVPNANFNGTSSITYRAWDKTTGVAGQTADTRTTGGVTPFSVGEVTKSITVTAVNDQPDVSFDTAGAVFDSGTSNITVTEDVGAQTHANFATPAAGGGTTESDQVSFTYDVTNNNNFLFTDDGQPTITENASTRKGTLTFTPKPNILTDATATVSVVVRDSGGTENTGVDSRTRTFTIRVDGVNDAPVLSSTSGSSLLNGSGTAFTAPRPTNQRSWLYRTRPSVPPVPFEPLAGTAGATPALVSDFAVASPAGGLTVSGG